MPAPSRSTFAATGALLLGSVAATADTARHGGCGDHLTWLGWSGWIVAVGAFFASVVTVTLDLRARRWWALGPALLGAAALAVAVATVVVAIATESLCGLQIDP